MTRVLVDELRCAVCGLPINLGWARRTGRTTHIPCGDPDQLDDEQPGEDPPYDDVTVHVVIAHARATATQRPPAAPPRPQRHPAHRVPEPRPAKLLTSLEDLAAEPDAELAWQADALCAQVDPELFFPEKGGTTGPAKAVCGRCDVREQCLEYALDNGERFGIWGGLSERQRRRLNVAGDDPDDLDEDDEDVPETLRELCASGGLLAHAGIPLTTAQTYAAKGMFIEPCGTGAHGARAYRPSAVTDWLDNRRDHRRREQAS